MKTGLADPNVLDEASRTALDIGADTLLANWLRDTCTVPTAGTLDPDSELARALPAKHRHRYDRAFCRDVLGALHVVLDRLADRTNDAPVCSNTAQELAFRALIDTAATFLDDDVDDTALYVFYEQRVFDTDIELLFDPQLDGIEHPQLHQTRSAPTNLAFDRWFVPFSGGWPSPSPDGPADA